MKNRLTLYKKMLWDYRITYIFPFLSKCYHTNLGFCNYLFFKGAHLEKLPELNSFRPDLINGYASIYWFPNGKKKKRIKCIKAAIKLCKL